MKGNDKHKIHQILLPMVILMVVMVVCRVVLAVLVVQMVEMVVPVVTIIIILEMAAYLKEINHLIHTRTYYQKSPNKYKIKKIKRKNQSNKLRINLSNQRNQCQAKVDQALYNHLKVLLVVIQRLGHLLLQINQIPRLKVMIIQVKMVQVHYVQFRLNKKKRDKQVSITLILHNKKWKLLLQPKETRN